MKENKEHQEESFSIRIREKTKRGFTLFEVMLAVALFAVLGIVCLENHLLNMTMIKRMKEEERCLLAARSQAVLFSLENDIPKSGTCLLPYDDCRYELSLSDLTLPETVRGESSLSYQFSLTEMTVFFGKASLTVPITLTKGLDRREP